MTKEQYIHIGGPNDGRNLQNFDSSQYEDMSSAFTQTDPTSGVTKTAVRHVNLTDDQAVYRLLTAYPDSDSRNL